MKKPNTSFSSRLQADLSASIVVALVALPLCLGIAMASGAPLFSGIIAGIVGGIVVGAASGSQVGVSGPAAGLVVIVLTAIADLGAFNIFLLSVAIAGILQIIFGLLRAGIIGYYFPNSVIKGMLSGIGITIFLKQIPHAFGYDKDPEGEMSFLQPDGHNTFSELGYMLDAISYGPLLIAALSLFILIAWERPRIKQMKVAKVIQGPLLVVVIGIVLQTLFVGTGLNISGEHLVQLPIAGSWSEFLGLFTLPDFSQLMNPKVYTVAFTIAVVASLETLLCVEATDKLDPWKRLAPANQELLAQGLGNFVSGMIGGLPVTQVIVRSTANIQSGGRTKISAISHGVLLIIAVLVLPSVLNKLPLASLAAVLLLIGYKLANPKLFVALYKKGWTQFAPFLVTVLGILLTDLLMGIGLGMLVGIFQILWQNYNSPFTFDDDTDAQTTKVMLSEHVSFLNKAGIMHSLQRVPNGHTVIVDATKSRYIHPDVYDILEDFKEQAEDRDIQLDLQGISLAT